LLLIKLGMKNKMLIIAIWAINFTGSHAQISQDSVLQIIRKHGLKESKVMDIAWNITDGNGPRLTGSPGIKKARTWAQSELKSWGMNNVHEEAWGPFGNGWELKNFSMNCRAPYYFPIIAYPKAWCPAVKGTLTGEVIYLDAGTVEELAKYKGKLKGKFVLLDTVRVVEEWFKPTGKRLEDKDLLELAQAEMPSRSRSGRWNWNPPAFSKALWELIYDEKPLAILERNYKGDLGTVFISGARARKGNARDKNAEVLPQAILGVEHYNRLLRMSLKDEKVILDMSLDVQISNPEGMDANVIADIEGSAKKNELVMFGAHFDSWHAGTGATDNGCGSSVMMEAARILKATFKEAGITPKRTLRLGLWSGEEQGLLGSEAYAEQHLADYDTLGAVEKLKPEASKVSAYYNMDNGTGRIRGIYLQGNAECDAVFRPWFGKFKDLDAHTITLSNTGGTDHLTFVKCGIPGFQFIQDAVSYSTRTHHSNMDNWDHLVADDLMQAATIVASLVYLTSEMDEMLPREELKLD